MVDISTAAYPKTTEPTEGKDASSFSAGTKTQREPIGSSGTEVFAGYFSEEYLQNLRGTTAAKKWDEMRRSESQIAMLLNAIMNPIKSANWDFQAYSSDLNHEKQKELAKVCIKEMIDFESTLHEILTFIPFGFSLFEVVHSVIFNHPRFGTFNGLKTLGFRSQKTIESWDIEKKTGRLKGVHQYVYSDVGDNQYIPGEFLVCFSNQKEGDNYEGISALRPMFGSYFRKNLYLKLSAIGVEKNAVGTAVGTIPSGKEKTDEVEEFKKILSSFTSHELAFITKPEGWEIEIIKGEFDASKIKDLIVLENTEMVNSLVANFLALGMSGGGGAFALGSDLSDFFLGGIQAYANLICGVFNRKIIPDLVKLNYGQQEGYPKMTCTGINDKAGKELAEIVKAYIDAKAITPDPTLEDFLRAQHKLPKKEVVTVTTTTVETPTIQLDEKYRKQFDKAKNEIKEAMQSNLLKMYGDLKDVLKTKYNAAAPSDRIKTALGVSMPGKVAYRGVMKDLMAQVAFESLKDAAASVGKKTFKLNEVLKLADAQKGGYYAALPAYVRKIIDAQSMLVAETQAADIEKVVFFQFTSSAAATDDIATILNDIDSSVLPVINGSTSTGMSVDAAAANAVAQVANQASMSFFFEPEVLEEIESFTFYNEDPVSDICKEMNGTTVAVGDPALDTYMTPLHHNCKSRWRANLKGVKGNPEVQYGGQSLSQKALDSITLSESYSLINAVCC